MIYNSGIETYFFTNLIFIFMSFIANLWQTNRPMMILFAILIVVIPFLVFYIRKAKTEHPKGLIAAALSNMGERFGYYIMNAVLLFYLNG